MKFVQICNFLHTVKSICAYGSRMFKTTSTLVTAWVDALDQNIALFKPQCKTKIVYTLLKQLHQ